MAQNRAIKEVLEKYGITADDFADELADVLHDYQVVSKQYGEACRHFYKPDKPRRAGREYQCPHCKKRVFPYDNFCRNCGKKMGWRN